MPPPVDFDVDKANADLKQTVDPFQYMAKYVTYSAKYNQQQEAKQQAVQVVSGRTTARLAARAPCLRLRLRPR